jgi:hypothetical protein
MSIAVKRGYEWDFSELFNTQCSIVLITNTPIFKRGTSKRGEAHEITPDSILC